jgi:hypothetical protein
MPRALITFSVILSLAGLAATRTIAAAQPQPSAGAARHCGSAHYPGSGYFTSLSVRGTSCRTGRKIELAYYHCRLHHGKRGRCHSRVRGYGCKERRTSIPTEIDARVTCRRGGAKVVHTYQQNT